MQKDSVLNRRNAKMLKIKDSVTLAFLEQRVDDTWQAGIFDLSRNRIFCTRESKTQEDARQELQSFIDAQNLTTKKVYLQMWYYTEFKD